jgi:hypothetical protein
MPNINPQQEPISVRRYLRQEPQCNRIIQPVISLIPRLEYHSQMQIPIRLLRSARLEKNIRPVIGLEVVARVCAKNAGLRVSEAPVGAYVEDFALQARAGEVSAYDWTVCWLRTGWNLVLVEERGLLCNAYSTRSFANVDPILAVGEAGIQEFERGCYGFFQAIRCYRDLGA